MNDARQKATAADAIIARIITNDWRLFLLLAVVMALLSLWGGQFALIGEDTLLGIPSGCFILLHLFTWAICLRLLITFPRGQSFRRAALTIMGLALCCRLLLLPMPPSDDINRYLWEGQLISHGFSPYTNSPQESHQLVYNSNTPVDPYYAGINHPELTAIYPPGVQLLFAAIAKFWYSVIAIKLTMIIFDLGTLWLLLLILRDRLLPLRWALLYAVNPVILFSFSGQGHLDAIQLFLLVAALYCWRRQRWVLMFVAAGLAVQIKYVAILCWPFLLNRKNLKWSWLAPVAALLPMLYFLPDGSAIFSTLCYYAKWFHFNGALHGVLTGFGADPTAAISWCKFILVTLIVGGYLLLHPGRYATRLTSPLFGIFYTFAVILVVSPTVHYWYISWIIPFIVLLPAGSWVLLCGTIGFAYIATGNMVQSDNWGLPVWAQLLVWVGPALLLTRELYRAGKRWSFNVAPAPAKTVSVIVPVKDEEEQLADCLAAINHQKYLGEIIVVDGGSVDATRKLAAETGATVIEHDRLLADGGGRGGQIAAGVAAATGDVIVIVHADSRLAPGTLTRIMTMFNRNPDCIGGAVGALFPTRGWKFRVLEWANNFRATFLGISFGDQIQFFRRQPLQERQLFPAVPLMEDVELSLRLNAMGRTVFLWGTSAASPRRWRLGSVRRTLLVLRLVGEYLLHRLVRQPDTVAMYRRYYGEER